MITCTLGNVWVRVAGTPDECDWLYHCLAVRAPNYIHARAYRLRQWDGWLRFYQPKRQVFPAGLLPHVLERAHAAAHAVRVTDARPTPFPVRDPIALETATLFADQDAAVQQLMTRTVADPPLWFPRGVVQAPTGSGKTYLLAGLCAQFPRATIGVFVHRRELLHQTQRELQRLLARPIGLIGDTVREPNRITVCTVQTLAAAGPAATPFLRSLHVLLLDECHHYGQAKTFMQVLQQIPAVVRIGVSATPWKQGHAEQEFRLLGHTGPLLSLGQPGEYIAQERLAPVQVHYLPITTPTHITHLPWPTCYEEGIVQNDERNRLLASIASASAQAGRLTLVLVSRVAHGQTLAALCDNAPFVSGTESSAVRQACLAAFASGERPLLIATTIFDEGINIPDIEHLVLAGGGKSELQTLQRIGRGMRFRPGKHLLVTDCADDTHRILRRHTRARQATCRTAGYEVRA